MNDIKVDLESVAQLIAVKMPGAKVDAKNNAVAVPVTLLFSPGQIGGNGWRWKAMLPNGKCIGVSYMSMNHETLEDYEENPREVARFILKERVQGRRRK